MYIIIHVVFFCVIVASYKGVCGYIWRIVYRTWNPTKLERIYMRFLLIIPLIMSAVWVLVTLHSVVIPILQQGLGRTVKIMDQTIIVTTQLIAVVRTMTYLVIGLLIVVKIPQIIPKREIEILVSIIEIIIIAENIGYLLKIGLSHSFWLIFIGTFIFCFIIFISLGFVRGLAISFMFPLTYLCGTMFFGVLLDLAGSSYGIYGLGLVFLVVLVFASLPMLVASTPNLIELWAWLSGIYFDFIDFRCFNGFNYDKLFCLSWTSDLSMLGENIFESIRKGKYYNYLPIVVKSDYTPRDVDRIPGTIIDVFLLGRSIDARSLTLRWFYMNGLKPKLLEDKVVWFLTGLINSDAITCVSEVLNIPAFALRGLYDKLRSDPSEFYDSIRRLGINVPKKLFLNALRNPEHVVPLLVYSVPETLDFLRRYINFASIDGFVESVISGETGIIAWTSIETLQRIVQSLVSRGRKNLAISVINTWVKVFPRRYWPMASRTILYRLKSWGLDIGDFANLDWFWGFVSLYPEMLENEMFVKYIREDIFCRYWSEIDYDWIKRYVAHNPDLAECLDPQIVEKLVRDGVLEPSIFSIFGRDHLLNMLVTEPKLLVLGAKYLDEDIIFDALSRMSRKKLDDLLCFLSEKSLDIQQIPKRLFTGIIRRIRANRILECLHIFPPYLWQEIFDVLYSTYGDGLVDKLLDVLSHENANIIFLLLLAINTPDAFAAMAKVSNMISGELRNVVQYVFGSGPVPENLDELIIKYPVLINALREEDLSILANLTRKILDIYNRAVDKLLSIGGKVSAEALTWLAEKVKSNIIDVKEAVKIVLAKPRPFDTLVFKKVKNIEGFLEAVKRTLGR